MSNSEWNDPEANRLPEKVAELAEQKQLPRDTKRTRIVVVGLGMVGVAFIEKLMKFDVKRREYDVIVIGEEQHLAYNRVGLTSFFQHRNVENLYLNPKEWYSSMPEGSLNYHLNTLVTEIHREHKLVTCSDGSTVPYDILVLATGSDALLPRHTPGHDAKGVFVYRTIEDLQKLIEFASTRKGTTGAVVGGGLLGLEAAKAMMDLEDFGKVKLIERNRWVLSRQLDGDAGSMVVEQVQKLGLDVLLSKRVGRVNTDDDNNVTGVTFEDGEMMDCSCICFAIGIRARDELARKADIKCADRGGGIVIDNSLQTSCPDVYAIGECASWENSTFGLIAPGIDMADVLAFNLTQAKAHSPRTFQRPDLSTKLKLLGVEVASFGDFFADRDGPKDPPVVGRHAARKAKEAEGESKDRVKTLTDGPAPAPVKALTYKDPFQQVYKKFLFTLDGKYLLGGMMIGDTKDYIKLVPMVKKKKALDMLPSEFIIGASKGDDDGSDLAEDTQICSCHNVLKRDLANSIKDGTCSSIGDVKACTKAGTGCGGCMPLVQSIFNKEMAALGNEVKNHLCSHFAHSRSDLFNIVYVRKLDSFEAIMRQCGTNPDSTGCEACKPAVGSILASLFNKHILDANNRGLQDTNDKFLANIQRNGTFSVIPRVSGGEITPDKLIVIGTVAKKYNLYTKITGGQRIDMFGAKKHQLLDIWQELVDGGMESGHAYAKSLRTVKSCVGTSWCRFGIGDSVGMAVRLEERYKSIRSPHKIKGGVSGCVRECAEAQNKDFGLIATEKGFNVFVGGNGGASPRHAELLAKDVAPDDVIPLLDRYLAFYMRTADKLQRTARWIENLDGGIAYLREVILQDKLGICGELEKQMQELVGTFFCEWTEALRNPEKRKWFAQFANTDEVEAKAERAGPPEDGAIEKPITNGVAPPTNGDVQSSDDNTEMRNPPQNDVQPEEKPDQDNDPTNAQEPIEILTERTQPVPAPWPTTSATTDFRNHPWSTLSWTRILPAHRLPASSTGSSAPIIHGGTQLALFHVRGKYYATQQMCPHKRTFALSEGLIGDDFPSNSSGNSNNDETADKDNRGKHNDAQEKNGTKEDEGKIWISCPFHKRNFTLSGSQPGACSSDPTLNIATFAAEARDDGWVWVKLPEKEELDALLSTERWKVRAGETEDTMKALDATLRAKGMKGRKVQGASHLRGGLGSEAKAGMILAGGERRDGVDW